jgi:4-hydroxy-tetrahydrodipicolinate reductase
MSPIRVAIIGCTGRTGQAVLRSVAGDPAFVVAAAVTTADDPALGCDAGQLIARGDLGVVVGAECAAACDVAIEFTLPAGCRAWATWCAESGVALVSGTTGLAEPDRAALRTAAERVPVVWAPNMSIGVNLLLRLAREAAARLDESWDVEICETHHRDKIDAPSGTARALLDAVCDARGDDPLGAATYGRFGHCGPRESGEVGVHALRLGGNVGEHAVHFASAGETLTLHHRAQSRDIFAAGALRAAHWVVGRPPGLYSMSDVLAD